MNLSVWVTKKVTPYYYQTNMNIQEDYVCDFISYLSYQLHCCTLPDKRCLSHGMLPLSGDDDVALFEWRR